MYLGPNRDLGRWRGPSVHTKGHLELYLQGNMYAAQDSQAEGAVLNTWMNLLLLTCIYTMVGFNTIMHYILIGKNKLPQASAIMHLYCKNTH